MIDGIRIKPEKIIGIEFDGAFELLVVVCLDKFEGLLIVFGVVKKLQLCINVVFFELDDAGGLLGEPANEKEDRVPFRDDLCDCRKARRKSSVFVDVIVDLELDLCDDGRLFRGYDVILEAKHLLLLAVRREGRGLCFLLKELDELMQSPSRASLSESFDEIADE